MKKVFSAALSSALVLTCPGLSSLAFAGGNFETPAPRRAGGGALSAQTAGVTLSNLSLSVLGQPLYRPQSGFSSGFSFGGLSRPAESLAAESLVQNAASAQSMALNAIVPMSAAASLPSFEDTGLSAAEPSVSAAVPPVGLLRVVSVQGPAPTPGAAASAQGLRASLGRFASTIQRRLSNPFALSSAMPASDVPDSLADASLEISPDASYNPSPKDWRDEIGYSIFLDRFARGPTAKPVKDPGNGISRHGGDIPGVISKLDYLAGLGVTTLIISSWVENPLEIYHGYGPSHLLKVDSHRGTMADIKRLRAETKKRGMRLIFDLVTNHAGPVFDYVDGNDWVDMKKEAKQIRGWRYDFKPVELAKDEHFSRHGVIGQGDHNWRDPEQALNGDFPPDFRHFATEQESTQKLLTHVALWWLKETDADGVRLDAYRHVASSFWEYLFRAIRSFTAKLGKRNFLRLGEISTGIDKEIKDAMGPEGLNGALNYPAYRRDNYALHGKAPTRELENSLKRTLEVFGKAAQWLWRLIDNQDGFRFLRGSTPIGLLKVAFAHTLFSIGIPIIYYGTEQAFRQAVERLDPEDFADLIDPRNREDMFAEGKYKSASSKGDKFDVNSPTYRDFRWFADVRKAYAPLRRGEEYVRWSDPGGAGIFAFSRVYEGEEVLVVMNTSDQARSADMEVDANIIPPDTELVDVLDPSYHSATYRPDRAGSRVAVEVPPHGVRVLVQRADYVPVPRTEGR